MSRWIRVTEKKYNCYYEKYDYAEVIINIDRIEWICCADINSTTIKVGDKYLELSRESYDKLMQIIESEAV